MCVETRNKAWERPAIDADIPILAKHFPGIHFQEMLQAMSIDGCLPLTVDLVLFGAILSADRDSLGMRYVPFAGRNPEAPQTVVKLDVMEGIVDWMENTALGSYMWKAASDWSESRYGCKVEFSMNCGCGSVCCKSYENGAWPEWVRRFNESRRLMYGRTNVIWQSTFQGTDITEGQYRMWLRMRKALESLP